MKICFISDTHTKHELLTPDLPDADVIAHAGDITGNGGSGAIKDFLEWFSGLDQYKYKIFVAGNHDWLFERDKLFARELVPDNVIYLEDEEVVLDGIKFYGSPVQLPFCNWAFNRPEYKLNQHWQAIPDDTDVLITHSPPYGVKDYARLGTETHCGSEGLYHEVTDRIKPKIHCFGHIHSEYGLSEIGETTFINASNLNDNYQYQNRPILVRI